MSGETSLQPRDFLDGGWSEPASCNKLSSSRRIPKGCWRLTRQVELITGGLICCRSLCWKHMSWQSTNERLKLFSYKETLWLLILWKLIMELRYSLFQEGTCLHPQFEHFSSSWSECLFYIYICVYVRVYIYIYRYRYFFSLHICLLEINYGSRIILLWCLPAAVSDWDLAVLTLCIYRC